MARLNARLRKLQQQVGAKRGPVQFWVLSGDGFARCGDVVLTLEEFRRQHGIVETFTLKLGDHPPKDAA
jgi:hypothetical protein